ATLVHAAADRRTDRRPVTDEPVGHSVLSLIAAAAAAENASLYVLRPEQVIELSAAMSHADQAEVGDQTHRAEIARWIGGDRPEATGIPSTVLPDRPPQTRVGGRFFGPPGTLPVGDGHDRAASYGILHGDTDTAVAWLRAGEALSAAWLTATCHHLSILPISAPVEVTSTRERLRQLLSGL